jgi:hypothetical protein
MFRKDARMTITAENTYVLRDLMISAPTREEQGFTIITQERQDGRWKITSQTFTYWDELTDELKALFGQHIVHSGGFTCQSEWQYPNGREADTRWLIHLE